MSSEIEQPAHPQAAAALSEDSPVAGSLGPVSSIGLKLRHVLVPWKEKLGLNREQMRVLAVVLSLVVLTAGVVWLAFAAYRLIAERPAVDVAEAKVAPPAPPPPPAPKESAPKEEAPIDYAQSERQAQQALSDAEHQSQVDAAIKQADLYQWQTWQRTFTDIEANNKRLAERQRVEDVQAAEARRQARLEAQRQEADARQEAAEHAEALKAATEERAAERNRNRRRSFN